MGGARLERATALTTGAGTRQPLPAGSCPQRGADGRAGLLPAGAKRLALGIQRGAGAFDLALAGGEVRVVEWLLRRAVEFHDALE
jgi:hypothetical protein